MSRSPKSKKPLVGLELEPGAVVVADFDYAGARNVFVAVGSGRLHFYDQAPAG